MTAAILLLSPKFAHNVGGALRAAALLGAETLFWTGDRVPTPDDWPAGARLPREERMRCYRRTKLVHLDSERPIESATIPLVIHGAAPYVPVCVEISDAAEDLLLFEHPGNALYVFGPEDGSILKGIRKTCWRFAQIPNAIHEGNPDSRTPYNLATAVSIVLYDRLAKARAWDPPD